MYTTFSVFLFKVGVPVEWDDVEILSFFAFKKYLRCSRPCSRTPKSHENRGKSATQFQA